MLQSFKGKCTLCILKKKVSIGNDLWSCQNHSKDKGYKLDIPKKSANIRKLISQHHLLAAFHGCQKSGCYVLQKWCNSWRMVGEKGDTYTMIPSAKDCNFRNIMLEVIVGSIILSNQCNTLFNEMYGGDGSIDLDKAKWLSKSIIWGEEKTNNICKCFYKLYKKFQSI
jgi:hypothetical protein